MCVDQDWLRRERCSRGVRVSQGATPCATTELPASPSDDSKAQEPAPSSLDIDTGLQPQTAETPGSPTSLTPPSLSTELYGVAAGPREPGEMELGEPDGEDLGQLVELTDQEAPDPGSANAGPTDPVGADAGVTAPSESDVATDVPSDGGPPMPTAQCATGWSYDADGELCADDRASDEVRGPTGRCYWFSTQARTFNTARSTCSMRGQDWYVSMPRSVEEDEFLQTQLSADTWIGATDSAFPNNWRWADDDTTFWSGNECGSPANDSYTNWGDGEPSAANDEACARYHLAGGRWQWSDGDCREFQRVACQGPLPVAPTPKQRCRSPRSPSPSDFLEGIVVCARPLA